jgi:hypothetical protein
MRPYLKNNIKRDCGVAEVVEHLLVSRGHEFNPCRIAKKIKIAGQVYMLWYTPIILATWEAKIGRTMVPKKKLGDKSSPRIIELVLDWPELNHRPTFDYTTHWKEQMRLLHLP